MNNSSSSLFVDNHCLYEREQIFVVIQALVAAASVIPNIVVVLVYTLMQNKRRSTISNYLLFNQAIADLWISISLCYELGIIIYIKEANRLFTRIFILFNIGMLEYSLVLSLGTLFLASFERYLSITRSYFHKCSVTIPRLKHATVVVWIVSLIPTLTFVWLMNFNPHSKNSKVVAYSYTLDVLLSIAMLLIVYMLTITLKTARTSCNRKIVLSMHYSSLQRRRELAIIARKQCTKILVIFIAMLFVYIVTLLPFIIGRICFDTGMFSRISPCNQMTIAFLCHLFYKSSSVVNPFLTFCKEDYRSTATQLVMKYFKILSYDDDKKAQSEISKYTD